MSGTVRSPGAAGGRGVRRFRRPRTADRSNMPEFARDYRRPAVLASLAEKSAVRSGLASANALRTPAASRSVV